MPHSRLDREVKLPRLSLQRHCSLFFTCRDPTCSQGEGAGSIAHGLPREGQRDPSKLTQGLLSGEKTTSSQSPEDRVFLPHRELCCTFTPNQLGFLQVNPSKTQIHTAGGILKRILNTCDLDIKGSNRKSKQNAKTDG